MSKMKCHKLLMAGAASLLAAACVYEVETDDPGRRLPVSCIDVQELTPGATDGDYTLYYMADDDQPWTAHCVGMNEVFPMEYLTLAWTGDGHNYSSYAAGDQSPGETVITYYDRVRIDPYTLVVDTSDQRFAVSIGTLNHLNDPLQPVTSMPFGVAMSCDGTPTGSANIDLTGTPFVLVEQFCEGGTDPLGGPRVSDDHRVADLLGGGSCGWTAVTSGDGRCNSEPFNAGGGGLYLNLAYAK